MALDNYIAHAKQENGVWSDPHDLIEHLYGVSELAISLSCGSSVGWVRLAGRWHDLGKFRFYFQ